MYEKPKLNCIGKAQDVILGMGLVGHDLDGTWDGPIDLEFAADSETGTDCE